MEPLEQKYIYAVTIFFQSFARIRKKTYLKTYRKDTLSEAMGFLKYMLNLPEVNKGMVTKERLDPDRTRGKGLADNPKFKDFYDSV